MWIETTTAQRDENENTQEIPPGPGEVFVPGGNGMTPERLSWRLDRESGESWSAWPGSAICSTESISSRGRGGRGERHRSLRDLGGGSSPEGLLPWLSLPRPLPSPRPHPSYRKLRGMRNDAASRLRALSGRGIERSCPGFTPMEACGLETSRATSPRTSSGVVPDYDRASRLSCDTGSSFPRPDRRAR